MANVPLTFGAGAGSGSDDCTGARAQARAGYTFICSDTDDEPSAGLIADYSGSTAVTPSTAAQTMPTAGKYCPNNITVNAIPNQKSDSGNVALYPGNASKSYAAGWYNNAHGAQINQQTKTVSPTTSAQSVSPDSGYVLSGVNVAAIPSQQPDSGNVTLTASSPSKSYPAGWYNNAHGAQISAQSKSVTPAATAQTVSPDSGKVLSGVTVNAIPSQKAATTYTPSTSAQTIAAGQWLAGAQTIAAIPNQTAGGDVKLTASNTASNFAAGQWATTRHYVYVDVYTWS